MITTRYGIPSHWLKSNHPSASRLQTALPDILSFIRHSLLILAISLTSVNNSIACSPAEQFNVQFDEGSAQLNGSEAGRLGAWVTEMRQRFSNRPFYLLIAFQDENKPDEDLAERKGKWVKDFLIKFGEDPDAPIYGGTTIWRAENMGGQNTARPSTLSIELAPGCPNPCCRANEERKKGHI